MKPCLLLLAVASIAGCASSPTIQPVGSSRSHFDGVLYPGETTVISAEQTGAEEFRVFEEGASGFVSMQSVREVAEQRMREFCGGKSKLANTMSERVTTPPFILGNYPRIEIVFSCVHHQATSGPSAVQDLKYIKLVNLKKLLDDQVITQQEFEAEKAKVLAQP